MSTNPLKFIPKLIKPRSHTKKAENVKHRNSNSCGLCALCGDLA